MCIRIRIGIGIGVERYVRPRIPNRKIKARILYPQRNPNTATRRLIMLTLDVFVRRSTHVRLVIKVTQTWTRSTVLFVWGEVGQARARLCWRALPVYRCEARRAAGSRRHLPAGPLHTFYRSWTFVHKCLQIHCERRPRHKIGPQGLKCARQETGGTNFNGFLNFFQTNLVLRLTLIGFKWEPDLDLDSY